MDDLELELEDNKVEKRIKTLSDKVRLTSEERDEKAKLLETKEAELANASRERDFYKGFNQVSAKHQGAGEYQDKIWERVQKGVDIEEATVAVLYKEGKLQGTPAPVIERESPAGGSAPTTMTNGGAKTDADMSQAERRAALMEAESKGEFSL